MKHTEQFPRSAIDARGCRITVTAPPQRVVSLVPSQTELLVQLGVEENVVGVTRFCVRPKGFKEKKQIVGGTKNVNVKHVKALDPDFILANREENTCEAVEALDAIAPVYVTDVDSIQAAVDMIRTVGRLVKRRGYSDRLARKVDHRFEAIPHYEPIDAAYFIWRNPYRTIGYDTFIHDVMWYAGFVNVFGRCTRYPEVTLEEVAAAEPELLLLPSEPFPFQEKHAEELRALLPDIPMLQVDGQFFSWYGSRMLKTPAYIADLRKQLDGECLQPEG